MTWERRKDGRASCWPRSVCSLWRDGRRRRRPLPPGYPERDSILRLEEKFQNPPRGYGEVPFFWWLGDTLTREHLSWHLEKLKDMHVSSLQVNYAHDDKGASSTD